MSDHALTSELVRIIGERMLELFGNEQDPSVQTMRTLVREIRRRRDYGDGGWCTCSECSGFFDLEGSLDS